MRYVTVYTARNVLRVVAAAYEPLQLAELTAVRVTRTVTPSGERVKTVDPALTEALMRRILT